MEDGLAMEALAFTLLVLEVTEHFKQRSLVIKSTDSEHPLTHSFLTECRNPILTLGVQRRMHKARPLPRVWGE